ncbi:MAG: S41 family peptidase [Eubacteriales bacterium]
MEHDKNGFLKGALFGALAMLLVGGMLLLIVTNLGGTSIIDADVENKLALLQSYIDDRFLYDVDEEELQEGIYLGYVEALGDPYSTYYTAEETETILESTTGEYSGIGALMSQSIESGIITLVNVFDDSPAEEAGLLDGDILEMVNGVEVTGEELTNVVAQVKGEEGTDVEITVYRSSEMESITVSVTRGVVENPTVSYELKEENIGYIQVSEFDTVTYSQFKEALEDLETQGMEGLIIDLRSNPGGSLDTVCAMLELLLPEGIIVYTEDKDGNRNEVYSTGENEFDKPMAVLINGYSASASEIFAGAIQDYGIGQIVGETSYGKGVVQQMISLPDDTMLKITVSEYFTPLGRNIHGIGIEPDVEVSYDYNDLETDEQLEKAMEVVTE